VIVVVTGNGPPFQRLLDGVEALARARPTEAIWVQHGPARLPAGVAGAALVPRDELLRRMAEADAIACHSGSGTIADALSLGHTPVVLPRLRRFGEHVNDHQLELWKALAEEKRIVAIRTPEEIGAGVDEARRRPRRSPEAPHRERLVAAVSEELARRIHEPRRTRFGALALLGVIGPWLEIGLRSAGRDGKEDPTWMRRS
jgi:UDP-N-acetylglucosamine transferase subunit ALG13